MLLKTEKLMILLGQDSKVAYNAQLYVTYSLPAIILSGINDSQKKFLCCFKKNFVPMITNLINTLLYPLWCYIFIVHLDLGIAGCAIADVVNNFLTLLCNLIYTFSCEDLQETHVGISLDTFKTGNFSLQLNLGLWSVVNSVIEGYSWQLIMLVSGYLSVADQAANTIVMNIAMILFSVNFGLT